MCMSVCHFVHRVCVLVWCVCLFLQFLIIYACVVLYRFLCLCIFLCTFINYDFDELYLRLCIVMSVYLCVFAFVLVSCCIYAIFFNDFCLCLCDVEYMYVCAFLCLFPKCLFCVHWLDFLYPMWANIWDVCARVSVCVSGWGRVSSRGFAYRDGYWRSRGIRIIYESFLNDIANCINSLSWIWNVDYDVNDTQHHEYSFILDRFQVRM